MKICGLTREEDILYAAQQGADALGFVCGYPDSPRNLKLDKLRRLVKLVPPYVSSVVVTPLSNPAIFEIVKVVQPSLLQVSGEETTVLDALRDKVGFDRVIHTVHVGISVPEAIKQSKELSKKSKAVLLDSKGDGRKSPIAGGTGVVHDWSVSRRVRNALDPFPVILGGGLTPRNVSKAIDEVRPYAVDVSSGVEAEPGIKSRAKIKEFIQNAKKGKQ